MGSGSDFSQWQTSHNHGFRYGVGGQRMARQRAPRRLAPRQPHRIFSSGRRCGIRILHGDPEGGGLRRSPIRATGLAQPQGGALRISNAKPNPRTIACLSPGVYRRLDALRRQMGECRAVKAGLLALDSVPLPGCCNRSAPDIWCRRGNSGCCAYASGAKQTAGRIGTGNAADECRRAGRACAVERSNADI